MITLVSMPSSTEDIIPPSMIPTIPIEQSVPDIPPALEPIDKNNSFVLAA